MPSTPGGRWMADTEAWLKHYIWPHVGRRRGPGQGDFTGTWDLNVEATIESWNKLWVKLRQSERDARNRGLNLSCVWKKHNRAEGDRGAVDPGEGAVIMYARQFFPMVARLEELERLERTVKAQYSQGFRAGLEYAQEQLKAEEAMS